MKIPIAGTANCFVKLQPAELLCPESPIQLTSIDQKVVKKTGIIPENEARL
jgi:hypothetical protein